MAHDRFTVHEAVRLSSHERQIVTVTGWVRLTKISDDDCDIHSQLGADPSEHFPHVHSS